MTVRSHATSHTLGTENQGLTLASPPAASWHRICFIDWGEPLQAVSQRLLATRCMLAVTPSRGACIADFAKVPSAAYSPPDETTSAHPADEGTPAHSPPSTVAPAPARFAPAGSRGWRWIRHSACA